MTTKTYPRLIPPLKTVSFQNPSYAHPLPSPSLFFILTIRGSSWYVLPAWGVSASPPPTLAIWIPLELAQVTKTSTLPCPINSSQILSHVGNTLSFLGFGNTALSAGCFATSQRTVSPLYWLHFFCSPLRGFSANSPLFLFAPTHGESHRQPSTHLSSLWSQTSVSSPEFCWFGIHIFICCWKTSLGYLPRTSDLTYLKLNFNIFPQNLILVNGTTFYLAASARYPGITVDFFLSSYWL